MLLSRLADTRRALTATRSRNAKRDLIAEVLRDASADDVEIVVSYLSGSLRQRRTGVGWRTMQDPPPAAEQPSLTVAEVDQAFAEMAGLSGPGSALARTTAVRALLARATDDEQGLLFGLVSGELRQGRDGGRGAGRAGRRLRRTGGRGPSGRDAAVLDHRCRGGPAGRRTGGARGRRAAGRGRRAADARRERSGPRCRGGKTGLPVLVDHKLDGIRVQVHRVGRPGVDLHPQPGRHHRPAAGGRRHGPGPAAADSGAGRRGAVAARGRQPGGVPGGRLADHERASIPRRRPRPARCRCTSSTCCTSTGAICWTPRCGTGSRPCGSCSRRDHRAPRGLRDLRGGRLPVRRGRGRRLRGRGDQEPGRPVRRRPARRRLGQDQTAAHLRSGGHRGGVGTRSPAGLAVQPASRRPRSGVRRSDHARQDVQGPDRRAAHLADQGVPGPRGTPGRLHRLSGADHGGRDRL